HQHAVAHEHTVSHEHAVSDHDAVPDENSVGQHHAIAQQQTHIKEGETVIDCGSIRGQQCLAQHDRARKFVWISSLRRICFNHTVTKNKSARVYLLIIGDEFRTSRISVIKYYSTGPAKTLPVDVANLSRSRARQQGRAEWRR